MPGSKLKQWRPHYRAFLMCLYRSWKIDSQLFIFVLISEQNSEHEHTWNYFSYLNFKMIQFFIFSKYRTNAETTKNNNILITNAPILLCYVGTCIRIYGAIFDTDSGKECEKAKKNRSGNNILGAHFLLFSYLFTCIGTFKFEWDEMLHWGNF